MYLARFPCLSDFDWSPHSSPEIGSKGQETICRGFFCRDAGIEEFMVPGCTLATSVDTAPEEDAGALLRTRGDRTSRQDMNANNPQKSVNGARLPKQGRGPRFHVLVLAT